jgi:hypothetical protein
MNVDLAAFPEPASVTHRINARRCKHALKRYYFRARGKVEFYNFSE